MHLLNLFMYFFLLTIQFQTISSFTSFTTESFVPRFRIAANTNIVTHSASLVRLSALKSKPPPRFDTFCDIIVGSWSGFTDELMSDYQSVDSSSSLMGGEVEEVMRSCGGAVQGIREVGVTIINKNDNYISDDDDSNKPYHNRADDGFIYFDCGSYTSGPVQQSPSEIASTLFPISASLTFAPYTKSKMKKRRLYLQIDLDHSLNLKNIHISNLINQSHDLRVDASNLSFETDASVTSEKIKVKWYKEELCSMPSINQPWMLQRVKWSQLTYDDEIELEEEGTNVESKQTVDDYIHGWVSIKSTSSSSSSTTKVWANKNLDLFVPDINDNNDPNSISIQMGAIYTSTNQARAITRQYSPSGMLQRIVMHKGIISHSS